MSDKDPEQPKSAGVRSRRSWLRWLILGVVLGFLVISIFSGLGDHAWHYLKANQEKLQQWVDSHYVMAIVSFFVVYVIATGLSLPVATVLTLGIGALLGRWVGLALVSFASTMGATLAMLGSRYVLRDFIQSRFAARLDAINRGLAKDGVYYLLSLRLLPIFPFWLVNLGMGLTAIGLPTFWIVSQIGMLPGTFVYVNAGTELGRLESVKGIMSPTLLISFALLGLLPLIMKKVVGLVMGKRLDTL